MARPKLGDTETERMQLKITSAEIEAIDDWRFANRIPSRSEAVRRLCQIGLLADELSVKGRDIAGPYISELEKKLTESEKRFVPINVRRWVGEQAPTFLKMSAYILELEQLISLTKSGTSLEEMKPKSARRLAQLINYLEKKDDEDSK